MTGLGAACRALHHSLHSFVLGATVMTGSHKCTSKMSSLANAVQPQLGCYKALLVISPS